MKIVAYQKPQSTGRKYNKNTRKKYDFYQSPSPISKFADQERDVRRDVRPFNPKKTAFIPTGEAKGIIKELNEFASAERKKSGTHSRYKMPKTYDEVERWRRQFEGKATGWPMLKEISRFYHESDSAKAFHLETGKDESSYVFRVEPKEDDGIHQHTSEDANGYGVYNSIPDYKRNAGGPEAIRAYGAHQTGLYPVEKFSDELNRAMLGGANGKRGWFNFGSPIRALHFWLAKSRNESESGNQFVIRMFRVPSALSKAIALKSAPEHEASHYLRSPLNTDLVAPNQFGLSAAFTEVMNRHIEPGSFREIDPKELFPDLKTTQAKQGRDKSGFEVRKALLLGMLDKTRHEQSSPALVDFLKLAYEEHQESIASKARRKRLTPRPMKDEAIGQV
ncbi:hypothetical protein DFQ28_005942 [Apophysomyces sp. BC1034]|nr:hypothetical protein DFQ30_006411 [Apophysomyces sp. BC1015]KAG0187722.1 hypothetical protein DFQ28_005942 [Apophysomyces sp. BC1034]